MERELQGQNKSESKEIDLMAQFFEEEEDIGTSVADNEKEKIILKENIPYHLRASLEYYLQLNNPVLGLLYYINYRNKIDKQSVHFECIFLLIKK